MNNFCPPKNSIFISYSRESEEHILWVRKLANTFQKQGYNIILDSEVNPEPEIPSDDIKSLLEFFRIHQRVSYITPGGVFRARVELPKDKKLPFKWKVFQKKIYQMIDVVSKCRFVLMIHTPRFYKCKIRSVCPPSTDLV